MLKLIPHQLLELTAQVVNHDDKATLVLDTVWPKANHPYPHRLLTLTLPPDQLRQLGEFILKELA